MLQITPRKRLSASDFSSHAFAGNSKQHVSQSDWSRRSQWDSSEEYESVSSWMSVGVPSETATADSQKGRSAKQTSSPDKWHHKHTRTIETHQITWFLQNITCLLENMDHIINSITGLDSEDRHSYQSVSSLSNPESRKQIECSAYDWNLYCIPDNQRQRRACPCMRDKASSRFSFITEPRSAQYH